MYIYSQSEYDLGYRDARSGAKYNLPFPRNLDSINSMECNKSYRQGWEQGLLDVQAEQLCFDF